MSIVISEVSICGMREAHFKQLLSYIMLAEDDGFYYGNEKQFKKRHDELLDWVSQLVALSRQEGVFIPKK
jgi:hypothetical protein